MRIRSYKAGSFVMEKSGDQWKDIGCPRTEGNDIKSLHIFLMILLRHIFSTIYVKSKFSFFFTIFLQLIDKICRQQIASQSYIFNIYALLYYLYYFFVLFSGMYYLTLLKTLQKESYIQIYFFGESKELVYILKHVRLSFFRYLTEKAIRVSNFPQLKLTGVIFQKRLLHTVCILNQYA